MTEVMPTATDWTLIRISDAPVFWASTYFIGVDALLAMPVWEGSQAAKKAIERGIIQVISREMAQNFNEHFSAKSEGARKYLEDQLSTRWRVIELQMAESVK